MYTYKKIVYGHVYLFVRISILELKRQLFLLMGLFFKQLGDLDLIWPLSNDWKECYTLQSIDYMEFLQKLGGLNENNFIMQILSRQRAYITKLCGQLQAITWVLFLLMYCTETLQAEMICRLRLLPCLKIQHMIINGYSKARMQAKQYSQRKGGPVLKHAGTHLT